MDAMYTTEALATGAGRNGHATVKDSDLDFALAIPKEMGGSGEGANPEQLFAAGYAACFHSALQAVARSQKVDLRAISILKLAEQYLGRADLTLLEVAYLLGFADPSNFFRAFRRWFGATPGEYRSRRGLGD